MGKRPIKELLLLQVGGYAGDIWGDSKGCCFVGAGCACLSFVVWIGQCLCSGREGRDIGSLVVSRDVRHFIVQFWGCEEWEGKRGSEGELGCRAEEEERGRRNESEQGGGECKWREKAKENERE